MTALRRAVLAAHHVLAEPLFIAAALSVGTVALLAGALWPTAVALAVSAAGLASATRPVPGAPDDCPLCARGLRLDSEENPDA